MVLGSEVCRIGSACDPSMMEGRNSSWQHDSKSKVNSILNYYYSLVFSKVDGGSFVPPGGGRGGGG